MVEVSGTNPIKHLMGLIDLGPTGSIQLQFAKLQLAQSEIYKSAASGKMSEITNKQEKQKEVSDVIKEARRIQDSLGKIDDTLKADMNIVANYCKKHDLHIDTLTMNKKETWDVALKSLTNYQETLGVSTQTDMVLLQDFMGQYNNYLQGANKSISEANQTLQGILTR